MPAPLFSQQQAFPLQRGSGQLSEGGTSRHGGAGLLNRKNFSWTDSQASVPQPPAVAAPPSQAASSSSAPRIFEIAVASAVVKAEPDMSSRMKTKKSRGARILCSEQTLNGWLKLASEPGWLLSYTRDVEGYAEIAVFAADQPEPVLAVPRHQPQGICCLEVVFPSGVPIRVAPDRRSSTTATRRQGEYVFAEAQNFDGWLKLAGEQGWMMAWSPEWGELLRPRRHLAGVDLWFLSDVWRCARQGSGCAAKSLTMKNVQDLKDLEQRVGESAVGEFERCRRAGAEQVTLLERGLLHDDDLKLGDGPLLRRLFAGLLKELVNQDHQWLQELLPNFNSSGHAKVPPLPGDEEGADGDDDDKWACHVSANSQLFGCLRADSLGCDFDPLDSNTFCCTTPIEIDGRTYRLAGNSVLFDPPNPVPVGVWNADERRIEPALSSIPGTQYATIFYFGRAYWLLPDGRVADPSTEAVVGMFETETGALDFVDASMPSDEIPLYDPVLDDAEPAHPSEYLERGRQAAKSGKLRAAVCLFEEALKCCSQQRSVDVEFECEILRARCECWFELKRWKELAEDTARITASGGDANLQSLEELNTWRRAAAGDVGHCGPAEVAAPSAAPSQGLEKCGFCSKHVTRENCCSSCMRTFYCGRECQRGHWKLHKKECRLLAEEL